MRTHRRTRPRTRTLSAVAALALAGTALGAGSASAASQHEGPTGHANAANPTSTARAAGIDRPGGGFMGWSASAHSGPQAPAYLKYKTVDNKVVAGPDLLDSGVQGIDVSGWQGNVDWPGQYGAGNRFAYVKATEGTGFTNDYFSQQYNGSYSAGMIRGSYHFARPDVSSGAAQADYFVAHGGGWSGDGKTLPGTLDIEYNPYGSTCFGKSASSMTSWIASFTNRYKALTGRDAVIYSTTDWWKTCTGNTTAFNQKNPLWIARYTSTPGALPGGWGYHTFWQFTDKPIDTDSFNGSMTGLKNLAKG